MSGGSGKGHFTHQLKRDSNKIAYKFIRARIKSRICNTKEREGVQVAQTTTYLLLLISSAISSADTIGRVGFAILDVTLFINGIPLVIIECKSPRLAAVDDSGFWNSVESGINQLLRYSNQRNAEELTEGVEHLFAWKQIMVSTCYYAARVSTTISDNRVCQSPEIFATSGVSKVLSPRRELV